MKQNEKKETCTVHYETMCEPLGWVPKRKVKNLQITVSISKEQHITYQLNNILITAQKAESSIKKYQRNHEY